jgi:SPX domain protein involved in polyphosphate accumulation
MDNSIFQRREIKFLVDARQRALLEQAFRGRMALDPHGESTVCNIYYDTPDYRLVRASLEKPVYKEKLRMRSYGVPGPEDTVFIELKEKYKGMVYKRRLTMSAAEATAYLAGEAPPPERSQMTREIDWFLHENAVRPKAYIACDRTAWVAKDDPELRITFD